MAPAKPPKASRPWRAALGKEAVPHRHEQPHAPLTRVPVPETIDEPEAEEEAAAAAGAAEAAEGGERVAVEPAAVAMVVAAVPPAMTAVVPVPFCAMACYLNWAWVLLTVGLMEKVIPFPQWPDCLQ